MLTKTAVIPLVFVFPILIWWKRGRLGPGDFLPVAACFLVASPLFVVAFLSEANFGGAGVNILAAEGAEWNLTFLERVLLCGRVLWFYVGKLLWPHPLIFVYPRWQIDSGQRGANRRRAGRQDELVIGFGGHLAGFEVLQLHGLVFR